MNKRALMLSAAAAALLSGPALAVGPTELKTVVTTEQKTSATGDLTIDAAGGINLKSATLPLLLIDSGNIVNNGGTLTASDQDTATAVTIDANGLTGSFTNNGTITMTGSGGTKRALYLTGSSFFNGDITFDSASSVHVVGDNSTGILTDTTSTLNGDLLLGGTFSMAPTTASSTTASGVTLANLQGTINGNVLITTGTSTTTVGSYSATGMGAAGVVILGPIQACNPAVVSGCAEIGTFSNSGTLAVAGIGTRSTSQTNPESGSALVVGNSIAGGILNNGPASGADTTTGATIQANGVTSATIQISPLASVPITIGLDSADATNGTFSFINRGTITASPVDPNKNAQTIAISGTSSMVNTTFTGGFFNSGIVSASATSTNPGVAVTATAMSVGDYVTLPQLYVSARSAGSTLGASAGSITATISGPLGGTAYGVLIHGATETGINVPSLTVEQGARIVASATVTDPTLVAVTALKAVAIEDDSGSLHVINNAGTISATVTTLTNGYTANASAVFLAANTSGVTFNNTGTVTGDVVFGSGSDNYTITGTSAVKASHTGAIDFGFSNTGAGGVNGSDTLHVAQYANVAGSITAEGALNVQIDGTGTLSVQNIITTATNNLSVHDLTVTGGTLTSAGTLNLTVTQGASGVSVVSASDMVTFGPGANLNVNYGSFITSSGTFNLISAPTGNLDISASDILRYNAAVGSSTTLPYLFNSASITKVNDGAGHDVLQLAVSTKTATELGLTGYANALFPYANAAIQSDNLLGAAMVAGITKSSDPTNPGAIAQAAYDAFAPDVSGGVRQVAISLTDQATGVVAARQRALRLFGKQAGDLTLWGNEFGEYISTHGGTVAANPTSYINAGPADGFKDHGFGFSLGLDEGAATSGWYGAAFTFYTGDVSANGGTSKTNTLWYILSAYSDWRGKGLFVDTQLNVGYGDFKGKRTLDLVVPPVAGSTLTSTFSREADSKRAGLVASLGATIGAIMNYGSTTAIPQISLDGMTLREEGYTETGGGTGYNLTVKPYYANSLRVFLGSEFREDINLGDFYLQPSARLGYRYDLLNDPVKLRANFADINSNLSGNQPGAVFTLQGPDPARGNYVLGAALAATTDNWTIGLNYDFVRGSNNATEQVGTLSLLGRI